MASRLTLPDVPVKHADFIPYLTSNLARPMPELLGPYKQFDGELREIFAQQPGHPALLNQYLNILPIFAGQEKDVKIRARDLESESTEEKERYIMPLDGDSRLPNGSPAIVEDLRTFKNQFAVFSESSLVDMDWRNVVAAGSAVVTSLMPVPTKYQSSKKALREYFHEIVAPASDVDLFLYGLSEEDAVKKILQIEQCVKDSILTECTTIRTKNAITIVSQYPTRHIQIVLRAYRSISEILTGFDVDCSCVAFDGKNVYASPRALTALMTQTNTIDLTRRSPSYENRLSKYSRRGFEVYWPHLDRSRIDPTIFEQSFGRTQGLARLLVLERLPTKSEREAYKTQRRLERGRPVPSNQSSFKTWGNIKDWYDDEVAEWVEDEDVSNYHTFTIPYGPKLHAKKIEKLLFIKDLLLNAEWNKPKDREVNLHRHPAFFGNAKDVIHDCCGFCPEPVTAEEHDVAEQEAKKYVSGALTFIKDDPGRQAVGSFNPITTDDWTDMAYVTNTSRLCQAIVAGDLQQCEECLGEPGADPNCRDYTGRTPLQLAVTALTSEIVQALINSGARLVSRLADGRTALHLAAARGGSEGLEMVRMILKKSELNKEEEAEKENARKKSRMAARKDCEDGDSQATDAKASDAKPNEADPHCPEDSDIEMINGPESDVDMHSTTTGSYVKVSKEAKAGELVLEADEGPDVYDVNITAWDTGASPLHLAIINGHVDIVKALVQDFGADVLLPITLFNQHDRTPRSALLTLVLAARLPLNTAKEMAKTLLELGASSAQAVRQTTALHFISGEKPELLHTLLSHDEPAAKRAINYLGVYGSIWQPSVQSPLMSAIQQGSSQAAIKLIQAGASPNIEFADWVKSIQREFEEVAKRDTKRNYEEFLKDVEPPVIAAVANELPDIALVLLWRGADPNALPKQTQAAIIETHWRRYNRMESLLDVVRRKMKSLQDYVVDSAPKEPDYKPKNPNSDYLTGVAPGSYRGFVHMKQVEAARQADKLLHEKYEHALKEHQERKGISEKAEAVKELLHKFKNVEADLLVRGAKTFKELFPDIKDEYEDRTREVTLENNKNEWGVVFGFKVHDLTEESLDAYLKLFEAAWEGDLEVIKSLTLHPWGPNKENTPLKIAVCDENDQNPFSISVLRGHKDVARAILEIAYAQFEPETSQEQTRYRISEEDENSEDGDSSSDVHVLEVLKDELKVENIADIATQVKSKVSPVALLGLVCSAKSLNEFRYRDAGACPKLTFGVDKREYEAFDGTSLLWWAIVSNDKELFTFVLDLDGEWTARMAKDISGTSPSKPIVDESNFTMAIKMGRLDMVAEMIRRYGAGIKLDELVNKSGVKYVEKPKYYQGLSVHGKKQSDWISAARGEHKHYHPVQSPPLLLAAWDGSLESVEWFLSDAPLRCYKEFAEKNKNHKLIRHLETAGGGFENVLSQWLAYRREFALHCAILTNPPDSESKKLIEYLIKAMPGSLETKTTKWGLTPLSLAFSLRRLEAAKVLLAAGADQTARDADGNNILHLLLCPINNRLYNEKNLKVFLDLIDKRLIPSLLTQRSSAEPGSLTPLARWARISSSYSSISGESHEEVLRIMLDFAAPTSNVDLELLDGSGQTLLHYAVTTKKEAWMSILLDRRPDLMYRENSVGRTPFELAEDAYIAGCVSKEPSPISTPSYFNRHPDPPSIIDREPEEYAPEHEREKKVDAESIWRLCREYMAKKPEKRKLVSLMDANEVARRLAKRAKRPGQQEGNRAWRGRRGHGRGYGSNWSEANNDGEEVKRCRDEVAEWYGVSSTPLDG